MKLYFIRHGETDWNKKKLFQGHSDIPLNETGIKQAEKAAEVLKDKNIEVVYASDLKRAYKTGEIVAAPHGLKPIKDARLREINFGAWEGLDFNGVYAKYKTEFDNWYKDSLNTKIPNGGNIQEVLDNLLLFINDIKNNAHQEVAVATHGGVIKALVGYAINDFTVLWQQDIPPGSVSTFHYDPDSNQFILADED